MWLKFEPEAEVDITLDLKSRSRVDSQRPT
jgi:hypothetical protein